jgi:hypothetical protein
MAYELETWRRDALGRSSFLSFGDSLEATCWHLDTTFATTYTIYNDMTPRATKIYQALAKLDPGPPNNPNKEVSLRWLHATHYRG